jgi:hypothetical protein
LERSAAIEREKREIVRPEPAPLQQQIDNAREAVFTAARARAKEFTPEEKQRLEEIERRRNHWNPVVWMPAGKEQREIFAGRDARVHDALDEANWSCPGLVEG